MSVAGPSGKLQSVTDQLTDFIQAKVLEMLTKVNIEQLQLRSNVSESDQLKNNVYILIKILHRLFVYVSVTKMSRFVTSFVTLISYI